MAATAHDIRHLHIEIAGLVQGVGFRPFVFRLAKQCQQRGWICNSLTGVCIAIEGQVEDQQRFLHALHTQLPPFATINSLHITEKALNGPVDFTILPSQTDGQPSVFVLPDLAPCPACLEELKNPESRFFRYPFTSCTYCGPRYSIMHAQPYDRQRTSMATFRMCKACASDYGSPDNRRFHAQTIACPICGPKATLYAADGQALTTDDEAVQCAVDMLKQGQIVALQGIGGFQLLVDARNPQAVERLRLKKQRPTKPLALLVADLAAAEALCKVDTLAKDALTSSAAPIVLLPRKADIAIADAVAPDSTLLGLMLPASPLQLLIARDFDGPLVATSGNRHNEPLCHDIAQAFSKLHAIADAFLCHDRAILRPLDDSIVRIIADQATVLRRARGYTPLALNVSPVLQPMLAVGGQWKNSIAISQGQQIIASQHLGDLDSEDSQRQFLHTRQDLQHFYDVDVQCIVHDLHPDYLSAQYARTQALKQIAIQHHVAHVMACMAEHDLSPPLLGFAWDGSGLGDDGTICGSECLLIDVDDYQRLAHFKPIHQPGGDQAARETRRSALAVLHALYGDDLPRLACLDAFNGNERHVLRQMLHKQLNCPESSSAGRLFDAVASLLDLCHINRFEGQAAMCLEQIASETALDQHYPFQIHDACPAQIDWTPTIQALIADIGRFPASEIAAKFHNTLAHIILHITLRTKQQRVVLSGGCFQNARLTEATTHLLQQAGFEVYRHRHIPPNDGGLAIGQLYGAHHLAKRATSPAPA